MNILGGMRDHSDKDFITTAVREFWEESARYLKEKKKKKRKKKRKE